MKIKSLFMLGLCAIALIGTSCTDDSRYTPGVPDATDGVYFPNSSDTKIILTENQQEFTLTIYRTNTTEAISVPLATNAPAQQFNVPATVDFVTGQPSAEITVGVNFDEITPNKAYKFTIEVAPDMVSNYGLASTTVTVEYAPWSQWERLTKDEYGTYTYNNAFASGDEEAAVYVRQSLNDPNIIQYRVGDYEDANVPENQQSALTLLGYMPYNLVIEYNRTNGTVKVPCVSCVVTYEGLPIQTGCAYSYGTDVNPAFIAGIDPLQVLKMSSFNEKTGVFSLMMVYYTDAQPFGNKMEYLQLPGYVNETVKVELNGKYVTEAGQEMQVFNIFMSEGISAVKYRIYNGSMTEAKAEAQAQGIAGDPNVEEVTASGNLAVAVEEGEHTIVIAGVDASGAFKAWGYLTFNYVSVAADPNEGWTSIGNVLYGEDYFATVFGSQGVGVTNYLVEAQQRDEEPTLYRLVDPYGQAWPYYGAFEDIVLNAPTGYLEFMIRAEDEAFVVTTESNMATDKGEKIVMSSMAFNNMVGAMQSGASLDDAIAEQKAAGTLGTFVNNKMTMPERELVWWIGEKGFYGNANGGFQINFAPDEEEEEEETAAYSARSLKTFAAKVQQAAVNRVADARVRNTPKAIILDNKTWFKYKGNKQSVNKISL